MSSNDASRPPLTSSDETILKELLDTLNKTESQFCCGGIISIPPEQKFSLFYNVGVNEQAKFGRLDLPQADPEQVQKLLEVCVPSKHGRGNETVLDETYRLARELPQGSFALTTDILSDSGVLENIQALTSPESTGLVARLYKLNAYATGGFFKPHRDTPKSNDHIGTIVVALPVPFQGGALRISHENKQVLFDWGEDQTSTPATVKLPWAFLFSDIEHEVLSVTSGTRITLAYDVFVSFKVQTRAVDATTLPLYVDLKAALNDPNFLPHGGELGLALSHSYPLNVLERSFSSFAKCLKGSDAALYRVLAALNIAMSTRFVYSLSQGDATDYEMGPDMEFKGPVRVSKYGTEVLYTTDQTYFPYSEGVWEEGVSQVIEELCDAVIEKDIIWVRRPSSGTSFEAGSYMTYGNEYEMSNIYASAALVLSIPTPATRAQS